MFIDPDARYSYLGNKMLDNSELYVPTALRPLCRPFIEPTNIKEVTKNVVHPVTNETITKYAKIINEPLLHNIWM